MVTSVIWVTSYFAETTFTLKLETGFTEQVPSLNAKLNCEIFRILDLEMRSLPHFRVLATANSQRHVSKSRGVHSLVTALLYSCSIVNTIGNCDTVKISTTEFTVYTRTE